MNRQSIAVGWSLRRLQYRPVICCPPAEEDYVKYVGVQEYQGEILILVDPGVCRVRKRTKTRKARLKMAESRRTDYSKLDTIELAPNRNTYYVKPVANNLLCNCCRHRLLQSGGLQSELIHVSP